MNIYELIASRETKISNNFFITADNWEDAQLEAKRFLDSEGLNLGILSEVSPNGQVREINVHDLTPKEAQAAAHYVYKVCNEEGWDVETIPLKGGEMDYIYLGYKTEVNPEFDNGWNHYKQLAFVDALVKGNYLT